MAIDPTAIGATSESRLYEWTDRDTLLYALGVGAGSGELAFTTENSHDTPQQVLPTFAVISCPASDGMTIFGTVDRGSVLHGSQQIRLFAPLPPAGTLGVINDVVDLQDKGPGKHAVVVLRTRGTDPDTHDIVVENVMTLVIRSAGGFGGVPGERSQGHAIPDRESDARAVMPTSPDQALIYRLTGDRNPLHSDPWFAREKAGFPTPILHGLCTYGFAGRALVAELGGGNASAIHSISARFTSPVFSGDTLTTSIWRIGDNRGVFQTEASSPDGSNARLVLADGFVEYAG